MLTAGPMDDALHGRLVEGLYVEALIMAEEAGDYFDRQGEVDQRGLTAMGRLGFTCESLKVTTRLMHVIAWLMAQKAWLRGEISADEIKGEAYRLGDGPVTRAADLLEFPFSVRALIEASEELFDRVARLQTLLQSRGEAFLPSSPARALINRLEQVF